MIVAESFLYKVITSSFDKLFHFETKEAISSIYFQTLMLSKPPLASPLIAFQPEKDCLIELHLC